MNVISRRQGRLITHKFEHDFWKRDSPSTFRELTVTLIIPVLILSMPKRSSLADTNMETHTKQEFHTKSDALY